MPHQQRSLNIIFVYHEVGVVHPHDEERFQEEEGCATSMGFVLLKKGKPALDQQEADDDCPEDSPFLLLDGLCASIDEGAEGELDGEQITEREFCQASDADHIENKYYKYANRYEIELHR